MCVALIQMGAYLGGGLALVQMWYLLFYGSSFASGCGDNDIVLHNFKLECVCARACAFMFETFPIILVC